MQITALSALWFAPFVLPICLWVAHSDMRVMRIPNLAVGALLLVFLVVGALVLPLPEYLWRWSHFLLILIVGMVLNAAGAIGAGDAKFAAAAAPYIALGDLRLLFALFAANIVAAYATHSIARHTPLRRLAPDWVSFNRGWDFPMGLSLGATLAIYLLLGTQFGR